MRITTLTALLVLASSAIIGVLAYLTAARIQYDSIDGTLKGAVVEARVKSLTTNPRPLPADVFSPFAIATMDAAGRTTVLRSAGYSADPLPFPDLTPEQVAAAQASPITVPGNPAYRISSVTPNPRRGTVIAAAPLTSVEENLRTLATSIIVSVLVVTVLGALLAWLLTRRTFRPVDDMVDAAGAIAAGDTSRRVPSAAEGTELGELAGALNTMIASLTASLAEVEASEVRLRTFVSDASHEIRTPLTVIRGYVELLEKQEADRSELEARALTRIDVESARLERLVSRLLLLQRMADVEQREPVDLAVIVRDAVGDFAALHPDRPVVMDVDDVEIIGSTEGWTQVIVNLMQNIDRYTPAGSTVHVTLNSDGATCVLDVDDAGPGIAPSNRAEAVARFGRLDASRSPENGGNGLGLSIVVAVVEAHAGHISLVDSPLGGLRVHIAVPVRVAQAPARPDDARA